MVLLNFSIRMNIPLSGHLVHRKIFCARNIYNIRCEFTINERKWFSLANFIIQKVNTHKIIDIQRNIE